MADLQTELKELNSSIQKLVQQHRSLKEEKTNLNSQLDEARQLLRQKESKIVILESELNIARIAKGMTKGGKDAEVARARIGALVREIDRCIALLNE